MKTHEEFIGKYVGVSHLTEGGTYIVQSIGIHSYNVYGLRPGALVVVLNHISDDIFECCLYRERNNPMRKLCNLYRYQLIEPKDVITPFKVWKNRKTLHLEMIEPKWFYNRNQNNYSC